MMYQQVTNPHLPEGSVSPQQSPTDQVSYWSASTISPPESPTNGPSTIRSVSPLNSSASPETEQPAVSAQITDVSSIPDATFAHTADSPVTPWSTTPCRSPDRISDLNLDAESTPSSESGSRVQEPTTNAGGSDERQNAPVTRSPSPEEDPVSIKDVRPPGESLTAIRELPETEVEQLQAELAKAEIRIQARDEQIADLQTTVSSQRTKLNYAIIAIEHMHSVVRGLALKLARADGSAAPPAPADAPLVRDPAKSYWIRKSWLAGCTPGPIARIEGLWAMNADPQNPTRSMQLALAEISRALRDADGLGLGRDARLTLRLLSAVVVRESGRPGQALAEIQGVVCEAHHAGFPDTATVAQFQRAVTLANLGRAAEAAWTFALARGAPGHAEAAEVNSELLMAMRLEHPEGDAQRYLPLTFSAVYPRPEDVDPPY